MTNIEKNDIVKSALEVSYIPNININTYKEKKYNKIPLSDIALLGSSFASISPFFRTVTQTFNYGINDGIAGKEGIYKVVFNGLSGNLASAKDGSGYLGTILNNGIQGQARLEKIDFAPITSTTTLPVDPAIIAMAIVLNKIDKKLDSIIEIQKEILDFLNKDKESKLLADLDILTDISQNYKFNIENTSYINTKLNLVQNINRHSLANIKFYRSQIEKIINNKDFIHLDVNTDDKMKKILDKFTYYKLSTYLYAFSSFVEVMLFKNFDSNYLKNIIDNIYNVSNEYHLFYTECYNSIEEYSKNSIETHLFNGLSFLSKATGDIISSIPIIDNLQIDDALIDFSKTLTKENEKKVQKSMNDFVNSKDSEIKVFIDNINIIDKVYNQPLELYYDNENLYLKNE